MRTILIFGLPILCIQMLMVMGCKSINMATRKGNNSVSDYKAFSNLLGNDVLDHCEAHLHEAMRLKHVLLQGSDDFLSTLNSYNDLLVHIDAAMNQAGLFSQVHPDEKIRKNAETCEQEISSFMTDLSLNKEVFMALKKGESAKLDPKAKRMLDDALRDFRRSGVDKDDATQEQIKKLQAKLVTIGQDFGQNIRDDRYVIVLDSVQELAGLPKDYIDSHPPRADGKIEISTDTPDYVPFMQYALSEKWRKELRTKYLNRGHKNGPVLKALIEGRYELAKLLGYSSYADYIVEDKMIKKASSIYEYNDKVAAIAKAGADKEKAALLAYKRRTNKDAQEIYGYESSFLEEAFKKEQFNFDSQEVRPYFAFERVRDGLMMVTGQLFGLRYSPVPDAKVWHESVSTYDVYDEHGLLGRIYLDLHPREGKYKHAAQFTVVSGLKDRQYPEGALVCNFPNPKDGPALMLHDQVVTLFHEFGHLLHHLFAGRHDWIPFSGTATEWDFVETPSQFLEEWAWDPKVLAMFALDHRSNKAIPAELVKKMRAADEFGKAMNARHQTFYAALSVNYFDKDPASFEPLELAKTLQAQYSPIPYEEGTRFPYSFGHLDGYSAMYYTYMWSLRIAKDFFEQFKGRDLMDPKLAKRYKDAILVPGGSKDAKDLVRDFLGRDAQFEPFERWLSTDPMVALGH